jgi:cell pole-organizing protein PopZ
MIATAQKIAEPSMEEILASIRRIIADDQARARMGAARTAPVATRATEERSVAQPIAEPPDAPAKVEDVSTDRPIAEDLPTVSDLSLAGDDTGPLIDEAASMAELVRDESPSIKKEAPTEEAPTQSSAQLLSAVVREARRSLTQDRTSERARSQPRAAVQDAAASAAPPAVASAPQDPPPAAAIETVEQAPRLADATSSATNQQETPELSAAAVAAQTQPSQMSGIATVRTAPPFQIATQQAPPPFSLDQAPMLSGEADATIARAFNSLSRTVLSDNARTLEDLVREMLRPLLKAWLDDNLPPLVERLVRMEIERVARGRPG